MRTICQIVRVTLACLLLLGFAGLDLGQTAFAKGKPIPSDADLILSGENAGEGHWPTTSVDIDGDGCDDLIVGAPGWNNDQGRVYVYYGGPDMDATADLVIDGEEGTAGRFGNTLGSGDVDNDGYGDFIVGAWDFGGSSTGRAYLFYGAGRENMAEGDVLVFDGDMDWGFLSVGWSEIIVDDIDDDGHDDIFMTAGIDDIEHYGYLYWGAKRSVMDGDPDRTFHPARDAWRYGFGKAAGDIDGDGYLDIVVGAMGYPSLEKGPGRVYLYYNQTIMSAGAEEIIAADLVFDAPDPGDICFGGNVGVGDVDGDGKDDIAVGAYNGGKAYLYYGNSIVGSTETPPPDLTFYGEEGAPPCWFGDMTVIGGDVNGDGYADILIGDRADDNWSRFVPTFRGRAYLFHGGNPMDNVPDRIFDGENRGDWMGDPPGGTFGDFNGDWTDDFTVSARMWPEGDENGRVYLYYGSAGDTTPPAAVADLAASNPTSYSIDLTWTAPGDDGSTRTASQYDIRYSMSAITDENWSTATECTGEPSPSPAGTTENFTVTGLSPETTYYFALKTADEVPNWSGLSNSPSATTTQAGLHTMHIHAIDMSLKQGGPNVNAVATVTIVDTDNYPVPGATVYGTWSDAAEDTDSGVTDVSGQVELKSDRVRNPASGTTFTFAVDDVGLTGWDYDPDSNVEASDSISVP